MDITHSSDLRRDAGNKGFPLYMVRTWFVPYIVGATKQQNYHVVFVDFVAKLSYSAVFRTWFVPWRITHSYDFRREASGEGFLTYHGSYLVRTMANGVGILVNVY